MSESEHAHKPAWDEIWIDDDGYPATLVVPCRDPACRFEAYILVPVNPEDWQEKSI